MRNKETDSAERPAKATASEPTFYDYVEWKRAEIERALKRANKHPDIYFRQEPYRLRAVTVVWPWSVTLSLVPSSLRCPNLRPVTRVALPAIRADRVFGNYRICNPLWPSD